MAEPAETQRVLVHADPSQFTLWLTLRCDTFHPMAAAGAPGTLRVVAVPRAAPIPAGHLLEVQQAGAAPRGAPPPWRPRLRVALRPLPDGRLTVDLTALDRRAGALLAVILADIRAELRAGPAGSPAPGRSRRPALAQRNADICADYERGAHLKDLARQYQLSEDSILRILREGRSARDAGAGG